MFHVHLNCFHRIAIYPSQVFVEPLYHSILPRFFHGHGIQRMLSPPHFCVARRGRYCSVHIARQSFHRPLSSVLKWAPLDGDEGIGGRVGGRGEAAALRTLDRVLGEESRVGGTWPKYRHSLEASLKAKPPKERPSVFPVFNPVPHATPPPTRTNLHSLTFRLTAHDKAHERPWK